MQINLSKLDKELYYHPQWPKDRPKLIKFFSQSILTDDDMLDFGRLYIKYSHLQSFKAGELGNYFNLMLNKMQIYDAQELFELTRKLYQNQHYDYC